MVILGIDIGGSAIKGALVDTAQGSFIGKKNRVEIAETCTPQELGLIVQSIVASFDYSGPVGIGFPGPVKQGKTWMAANLHAAWVGMDVAGLFGQNTGCICHVINDADAAGLAEMRFGAGKDVSGVVFMSTLGTGIGSAVFVNENLLPNSEFGHLKVRGEDVEERASDAARKLQKMSWKKWGKRLQEYYETIETLISPDLIIIGGGVSKKAEKFLPYLNLKAKILPAFLLNDAGIIGAAMYAEEMTIQTIKT